MAAPGSASPRRRRTPRCLAVEPATQAPRSSVHPRSTLAFDFEPRHPYGSAMDDVVEIECPYCGETIAVYIDPEMRGHMVQDCDVCCRPWEVLVERQDDGAPQITVHRAQ
jgi:hypothetical protein